jgi:hypothetical protein
MAVKRYQLMTQTAQIEDGVDLDLCNEGAVAIISAAPQ